MSTPIAMIDPMFVLTDSDRLDIEGDFAIDKNVQEKLPIPGTVVLSAKSHGFSAWTRTARLEARLPDGTIKLYFLKVATEDRGKTMMEGEYNSMVELYKSMPSFVPVPHTWGQYGASKVATYFFLCDFIHMDNSLPDAKLFCAQLAQLHRNSVSPNGKFGFHIATCHGKFPQIVDWDSSWSSFFAKLLQRALELDRETNGCWKELDEVSNRVIDLVIPRLLGALQSEGRVLKPSLIHGDLWEGNIGTDIETGKIYIFDSGAYYAHNEMEIGMWRCARNKISTEEYRRQYIREAGKSEPEEEWDDRNRLYCVKMDIIHSAHHAGSIVRQTAFDDLSYLVEKYAPVSLIGTWSGAEHDGLACPTAISDHVVEPSSASESPCGAIEEVFEGTELRD